MKPASSNRLFRPLHIALLACAGLALNVRADPVGSQAQLQGTLWYPNQGPDSVGNETQVSFSNASGFQAGSASAAAHLNETRSGTDASAGPGNIGTSGTTSLSASASASLGHLQASSQVSASSHSNGGSPVFFAHGAASVNQGGPPVARFDDSTFVFNPNYAPGTLIPVELTLDVNWSQGFNIGSAGWSFAGSGATAILAVQWVGNVSAYDIHRTDIPLSATGPQSIDFMVANGGSFDWWSSLTVFTGVSLSGTFENWADRTFPEVSASAFSNATADITPTSAYAGTVFTSVTGLVYEQPNPNPDPQPPSVPESPSTLALLGVGLGALAAARRLGRALVG